MQHRRSPKSARATRTAAVVLMTLALMLAASCAKRVPIYSPRMGDTSDHRAATKPADCLACHGASSLPGDHSASDLCSRCHKIAKGDAR
jgi:uncharacterized paraquat-inducible protein A